jgi:chromosomal replication initiator protein
MNVTPTLSVVQGIVKEVVTDLSPEPIKIDKIISEVARMYDVSENEILSRHKTAEVAKARQVAMYIARETTELSYKAIGESFGRDHTTALFSVNKIEELIKSSPYDKNLIEDMIKNLKTDN